MSETIFPLPQRPEGLLGRLFGIVMEWMNTRSYSATLRVLELGPGERLLELGYGTGKFLEMLKRSVPDASVAGVAPSQTMQRTASDRLAVLPGVDLREIRIGFERPLAWPDSSFEVVVAIHSFQFWTDPLESIREIRRVLKPGGRLVLVLRAHPNPPHWLPNAISRSPNEATEVMGLLRQNGFSATESNPSGSSKIVIGNATD